MKISILIIAHNEETHIEQCIRSILNQTKKADEVILIAHNCTDKTVEIASKFHITVIPFAGATGIVPARIEGIRHVTGDIVLCIDGDSFAKNNWVEVMVATLTRNENILVGSWIKFKGTNLCYILNIFNKYICVSENEKATSWIWGPSFAFWLKDKDKIVKIYQDSILYSREIGLSRNPEDYLLALMMNNTGNIQVTNKTYVTNYVKETTSSETIRRIVENFKNSRCIRNFVRSNSNLPH